MASAKSTATFFLCFSKCRVSLRAVFLPIPGRRLISLTASSKSFEGKCTWMMKLKDGCLYACIQYRLAHGFQPFPTALFHSTFTFQVNDEGTLLGLFLGMLTDLDKNSGDVFECVYLIIKNNKVI